MLSPRENWLVAERPRCKLQASGQVSAVLGCQPLLNQATTYKANTVHC